ncbi:MAG: DSD1 family PLP-dependent enzyme [Betaproteobacteria bacterium]
MNEASARLLQIGALLPPATIGMTLDEVDTPALLLNLDTFERNLAHLPQSLHGFSVRIRPHAKSHKCPEIAMRQIAHGAVGVCCQKVSEAEALVAGGVPDVLVANEVVGPQKIARLATLARGARVSVCVDDIDNIAGLGEAAHRAGSTLHVLVEINVGANRCGVEPGDSVLPLAQAIARHESLHFAGLQAYHGGAQHLRTPAARQQAIDEAIGEVRRTLSVLQAAGLRAETITGAGTGTYLLEAQSGIYNEIQPGSYVFMDADYGRNLDGGGEPVREFEQSLFILATVMSHTAPTRAVVDVGLKAHSIDSGMPLVFNLPGVRYTRASDEHGVLELDVPRAVRLGQKIKLVPGHCDPTVNLYDWLVCYRGDRVEALWAIAGRGAFY